MILQRRDMFHFAWNIWGWKKYFWTSRNCLRAEICNVVWRLSKWSYAVNGCCCDIICLCFWIKPSFPIYVRLLCSFGIHCQGEVTTAKRIQGIYFWNNSFGNKLGWLILLLRYHIFVNQVLLISMYRCFASGVCQTWVFRQTLGKMQFYHLPSHMHATNSK